MGRPRQNLTLSDVHTAQSAMLVLVVNEGGGPLLPTETPYLTRKEQKSNVRLACQVKVREDIKIEIPPELLSVKEYTCKCVDIKDLTYDVKQFRFELVEPATIDFVPGQYIQLLTPVYKKSSEEEGSVNRYVTNMG